MLLQNPKRLPEFLARLSIKDMLLAMSGNSPENPWSTSGSTSGNTSGSSSGKTPENNAGNNSSKPPAHTPWSVHPQGKQNRPSGGSSGGGNNHGGLPPIFRSLSQGGDEIPPHKILLFAGLIFLVLWSLSGLYRVQPEENGVVLRFGKYMHTVTDPGLHYHLPWPIETVLKPNVMFERRIEVGYRGNAYKKNEKTDIPEESMMLTGDANIVDLDFVVQWKVSDAKEFLFNIRDAEGTLKRVAESAMREVIGQNALQDIITDRREDIAIRVKSIMHDILQFYQSGIMVTQVLIQDASVPAPVLDAFEDVIRATQQAETIKNQALRYRNEIIPRAQGDAIRLVKEAEGYREQIVSEAQGDAQRFLNVYQVYSKAKKVTRERMYIETWQYILENNPSIILDGPNNVSPLSYLNLNNLRSDLKTAPKEQQ